MDRMAAIRESAVRLVVGRLHVVSSVKELCELSPNDGSETAGAGGRAVALTSQLLLAEDDSRGLDHSTMATEGVWRAVQDCWEGGQHEHLLSPMQRSSLIRTLQTAQLLLDALILLPPVLLHHVVEDLPRVPLEVVCRLHSADLLSIEAFLQASSGATSYLLSALGSVCCSRYDDKEQKVVMQTVAQTLCELIVSRSPAAVELVQQMPAAFLAQSGPTHYTLLRAAMECPAITPAAVREFASLLLSSSLAQPCYSLLEVVQGQSMWQYSALPDSTLLLYSDIVSALGSVHFIQSVQKASSVEQLNWPALLQALVCFLHIGTADTTGTADNTVYEVVRELATGGLEDEDSHLLSLALVIARQASLEGPHISPSYEKWLQTMFRDSGTSVVAGRKQLLFLLKTLTSFVPHDPVFALKAHILQPPRQVGKCLSQLSEYICLVSTRLQDLGEKVPTPGSEEIGCDAGSDVAEAIGYYIQYNRLSQLVMEASIFRRPYFVGRFLRSLLTPSPATDSDRESFIAALAKEKKIPLCMLRNYEKACLNLRENVSAHTPPPSSDGVTGVLRELPSALVEAQSMTMWLSQLSVSLRERPRPAPHAPVTVQLVDDILSVVCESITLLEGKPDASCRWINDLLAVLSEHTDLHLPLYLRLSELLNIQLLDLKASQMLGIAILLCHLFSLSVPLANVKDGCNTGADYCLNLFSGLRHSTSSCRAQSLRFSCMFVEHLLSCGCSKEHIVPDCLLHKAIYRWCTGVVERGFHPLVALIPPVTTMCIIIILYGLLRCIYPIAVEVVQRLVKEHCSFADQWQNCKLSFELWLSWELDVIPDGDKDACSRSYRWNVVFGDFLPTISAEELFISIFNAIARNPSRHCCSDFITIMQELWHVLLERKCPYSTLLHALKKVLSGTSCRALAVESMRLAWFLPPKSLFTSSDISVVADFIQHTLAPLVGYMMVLPPDITHYLVLSVCTVSEDALWQLCDKSSFFFASLMVHWHMLPSRASYSDELRALASWVYSGACGPLAPGTSGDQLAVLGVALWHHLTGSGSSPEAVSHLLALTPTPVVVMVAACCVHWLVPYCQDYLTQSTVDDELLQTCLQCEPSAVEVFSTAEEISGTDMQHSELMAMFRAAFSCEASALYPVLLLRLVGKLSLPMMQRLVTVPCFLRLCVVAHNSCLSVCAPLPSHPPLKYQPFSTEFVKNSNAAVKQLVELANHSQLQDVYDQLPWQSYHLVMPKIKRPI